MGEARGGEPRSGGRPATVSRRTLLRTVGAAGAGAVLAGGLSGCSSRTAASGATRVTMWSWLTGMDRYVEAFNAAQSEVFVELNVLAGGLSGGYAQQTNAIRAHNAPDIMHVEYQGLPQVLTTGGLREITEDVSDLGADYSSAAWRSVRPDGRTWAVPFDVAPMVLYYRKDLFDAHGLAVPSDWEQFRTTAEEVRRIDPRARLTTFPLNDGSFFAGMAWQARDPWWRIRGSSWQVDIAGAGTLRTARYWQELIDADLVRSHGTGTQDWIAAMHEGRLWSLLGAAWSAGTLNKSIPQDSGRWAVTTLPTWDGVPSTGMQGGSAFAVSADSEVPEAALTFLRWLSTAPEVPEIAASFTTLLPAYVPNRAVARESYDGGYFLGEPIYDVLDEAVRRVSDWTWGPTALGLFSTLENRFSPVTTGGRTLPEAIERVQRDAVRSMRGSGLSVIEGSAT
ncbi:ABC transporter substrate-binding protein [Actinopolyspora saharensis]|uniref:Carbohydrate ABC transporter substrate-binding protein, CUT1 family n=1 Tax=Actinopolyspora saharensis TaxID=995062 RepID=A0A1H0YTV4_9ACTN|nr:extracellular solute-binding protein [Actinopolyspora saharensis]SDQ18657.1 carbohydrate ABC transporter substrate-binding protein, CUT1 family [Actinopolyspora saharensis]